MGNERGRQSADLHRNAAADSSTPTVIVASPRRRMSLMTRAMCARFGPDASSDAELTAATVRFARAALDAGIVEPRHDADYWRLLDPTVTRLFGVVPNALKAPHWDALAAALELGAGIVNGERAAA